MGTIFAHPLTDTFARLAGLNKRYPPLVLTSPTEQEGWFPVAGLPAQGNARMVTALDNYRMAHPASDNLAPASRWFAGYLNDLMIVVFGCYLSDQRLPDLRPEQVWVRFDPHGEVAGLAWPGAQVSGLAENNNVTLSYGVVLDTIDALREHLQDELIRHLEPVSEALAASSVFKKPAIWALAADYVAKTMQWTARLLGDELLGIQEARLVNASVSKLHRNRGFIEVEGPSGPIYFVERAACCQKRYILGKTNCATCPNRPLEERIEMARGKAEKE